MGFPFFCDGLVLMRGESKRTCLKIIIPPTNLRNSKRRSLYFHYICLINYMSSDSDVLDEEELLSSDSKNSAISAPSRICSNLFCA